VVAGSTATSYAGVAAGAAERGGRRSRGSQLRVLRSTGRNDYHPYKVHAARGFGNILAAHGSLRPGERIGICQRAYQALEVCMTASPLCYGQQQMGDVRFKGL
jgi:hypothetical protein